MQYSLNFSHYDRSQMDHFCYTFRLIVFVILELDRPSPCSLSLYGKEWPRFVLELHILFMEKKQVIQVWSNLRLSK